MAAFRSASPWLAVAAGGADGAAGAGGGGGLLVAGLLGQGAAEEDTLQPGSLGLHYLFRHWLKQRPPWPWRGV